VFGASNVSKLLLQIPSHKRLDAVVTICYEAQARLRDPVYGCVAHIFALQQQVLYISCPSILILWYSCFYFIIDRSIDQVPSLLLPCMRFLCKEGGKLIKT
jgi:hypothetical protein